MNPLIFNYTESPEIDLIDLDLIEYSDKLNLQVLKGTETPAVHILNFDTETFTKSNVDTGESDHNIKHMIRSMVDTEIKTRSGADTETPGDRPSHHISVFQS